jgi:hypothetical protein
VKTFNRRVCVSACLILVAGLVGCAGLRKEPKPTVVAPGPESSPAYTPVPTVAPATPAPAEAKPLPTRPVKSAEAEKARKAGKAIGPVVTFAGITRADGSTVEPISVDSKGVPTFRNYIGSGFQIVVEGKPGISNLEVGRRLVGSSDAKDWRSRPDLEIEATNNLGDGSRAVCDRRPPKIGGIPAINPPSFAETKEIANTLDDFSCRFETFIESESSCVVTPHGDFSFIKPDTTTQFCMVVARAWNFPPGETLVSVRLRDAEGNPGPIAQFRLLRPTERPTPVRQEPQSTPTPRRRRP